MDADLPSLWGLGHLGEGQLHPMTGAGCYAGVAGLNALTESFQPVYVPATPPHTDEETEAQRGEITSPGSLSKWQSQNSNHDLTASHGPI